MRRAPACGRQWMARMRTAAALLLLGLLAGLAPPRADALDPDKAFEHYVANAWSIQQGLPQISALTIAQDRTGYLWVGTQAGLARFDGVRFTTYTPDVEPALKGVYVRALLADREGRLWVGTYKGLAVHEGGAFRAIPARDAARHPTLDIATIAERGDGSIVVASNDGVFSVEHNRLVALPSAPATAFALLADGERLWIGSTGTVLLLAHGQASAVPLPADAAGAAVSHLVQAQGRLWAGTSQGLYTRRDGPWQRYDDATLGTAPITAMLRDRDDNLWISTNSSLFRLRDGSVRERIDGNHRRSVRNIVSLFEDREGNLWLGSQLEGLTRLWNGWTRRYGSDHGLDDPIVWSLARGGDGTLWIGGNDGLSTFDGQRFHLVVPGRALPHPQAYTLLVEPDRVWIGTRRGLAIWHDGRVEMPALYAPMAGAQIGGIVRRPDGDLWFVTTAGLFVQHGQSLRRFGEADGLSDPRLRTIFQARDHRVWIGSQGGLFEWRGDRFKPAPGLPPGLDVISIGALPSGTLLVGVLTEALWVNGGHGWKIIGQAQGLAGNAPFFLTDDDRGYLWIAGIRGVERVPISEIDLFARGQIDRVHGEMLLNERGDRHSGQQGFCCNGAGLAKGELDGHVLWLPSRDGAVALDTHGIAKNGIAPEVVIERVKSGERWQQVDARSGHARFAADARDLVFDFTAPSFQDPNSIGIRYRLVGYDHDWRDLDDVARREVNYTNLPPGDYSFQVRASNNAGVWGRQIAHFDFSIRPWFHETPWFYACLALLLAAAVYGGYRRQQSLHAAQRAALEREVQARTHELSTTLEQLRATQDDLVRSEKLASLGSLVTGVAHEINTPLGICVTATSILEEELGQWREAMQAGRFDEREQRASLEQFEAAVQLLQTNTRRGAELVRSFKQVAADQSSGQHRDFDLAAYLDEIVLSLKPKLARAPCRVQVDCPPGIAMHTYPGALSQVVTNLLMNAVVHAFEGRSDGQVTIHARRDGEQVELTIGDDGVGMPAADLKRYFDPFFTTRRGIGGTGLGAHIVFNQVTSVLGGSIKVDSEPGKGTRVHLRLPCRHGGNGAA